MKTFGYSNAQGNSAQSFSAVIDGAFTGDGSVLNQDPSISASFRRESADSAPLRASALDKSRELARSIATSLRFEQAVKVGDGTDGATTLEIKPDTAAAMRVRAEAAAQIGYGLAIGAASAGEHQLALPSGSGIKWGNGVSGHQLTPTLRKEAFNNIDVRRSIAFSMGFNAAITRQTDVVMAWYPPIFINPDQTTVEIGLNILTVFNGAAHAISGDKTEFGRRNVARAFADGNVLNRFETRAVQLSKAETAGKLVANAAGVFPQTRTLGNRSIVTAPIKYDTEFNILGLSATAAILATGQQGHRDTIEPGAKIEYIWIKSEDNYIKLPLANIKTSNFIGAQQGDQFETLLNMRVKISLGKTLTRHDGTALTGALAALAANDVRLKLAVNMSGSLNIETGNGKVQAPQFTLLDATDAQGVSLPAGAARTALVDAVANFTQLGFDPECYRTNANRRQQGDRINTRRFNFHFVVPYRDPITAERPAHKQEEQDAQDLQNLLALTKIRIENEVIDRIAAQANSLRHYVDNRDHDAEPLDVQGLSQYYLIPTFAELNLDLTQFVDSVKSSERARDIQAAFVVTLRDMASRLYTDSQFKAGTDLQSGGTLPVPQVNVLTDPIIARYIFAEGELRTLGDFEMVLTTSLNFKLRNKIYISFRIPGSEASNEPNIFNFGHLFQSPELVLAANMTREGSYFAETQVQPRYELAEMTPVMGVVNVSGVKEVLRKVPGYTTLKGPHDITGMEDLAPVTP